MLRILSELQLVEIDQTARALTLLEAQRTQLERSATFRQAGVRLQTGQETLSKAPSHQPSAVAA